MIISDEKCFAFIHIPKCAGTSVRRGIEGFDSNGGRYWGVRAAPDGSMRDYAHLTLAQMESFEPDALAKIAAYHSVAVVREPKARFTSALLEYMQNYRKLSKAESDARVIAREALDVVERLEAGEGRDDYRLTHFNRQADYLLLGNGSPVSRVFAVEQMPAFVADVEAVLGITLDTARSNEAPLYVQSHGLKRFGKAIIDPLASRGWMPSSKILARRFSRHPAVRLFFARRTDVTQWVDPRVTRFIEEHYRVDAAIHAAVLNSANGLDGEAVARLPRT